MDILNVISTRIWRTSKQFEVIVVLGNVRHDHLNLRRYITYVILYNNRIDILFMMFAEYSQKKGLLEEQ